MGSSRQLNDWSNVIRAQSEVYSKQVLEEKNLEQMNKELYKQELENQLRQKEQQKLKERQEAALEKDLVTEKIRSFQAFQQRSKEEKQSVKNYLNSEYSSDIQQKSSLKREEAVKNLKEEQKILHNAREQLENLIEFNKNSKFHKTNEEQDFLRSKFKEKEDSFKKKLQEKNSDQGMIQGNIEKFNRRDMEIQENLKKLELQRSEKMKIFEPVIFEAYQKEKSKDSIIANWERQSQSKQKEEELLKLQQKLENKRKLADGLKDQLQEKVVKHGKMLNEFDLEKAKMDQQLSNYRLEAEKMKNNQIKSQRDYFEFLQSQKFDFDMKKASQNVMSPQERVLNQDILRNIGKNEDVVFRGVPGLHPRVSPLQNSFLRAYKGSTDNVNLSHLRSSSQNFQNYSELDTQRSQKVTRFDDLKHNPISNPVGESYHIGVNSPYYRGRGMKYIQPSNIFKKN
jgi:hypothetical protein